LVRNYGKHRDRQTDRVQDRKDQGRKRGIERHNIEIKRENSKGEQK
jgi:hypothetical protein